MVLEWMKWPVARLDEKDGIHYSKANIPQGKISSLGASPDCYYPWHWQLRTAHASFLINPSLKNPRIRQRKNFAMHIAGLERQLIKDALEIGLAQPFVQNLLDFRCTCSSSTKMG